MYTVFLVCAVVGGTMLVVQVILLLIGGGGDDMELAGGGMDDPSHLDVGGVGAEADVDPSVAGEHHDGAADVGDGGLTVISMKTLVAFITFFGLGGLEGLRRELHQGWALLIAIGAGTVALYVVAYIWYLLGRLGSSGNLQVKNAVGRTGTVYLRVPAKGEGKGKVTLTVQGRTLEWEAVSGGEAIATGRPVRVVGAILPSTLRVEEATD